MSLFFNLVHLRICHVWFAHQFKKQQNPYAATVDASMTRVVDGDLVKIMIWYDNEWGFTNQMIRQIKEL